MKVLSFLKIACLAVLLLTRAGAADKPVDLAKVDLFAFGGIGIAGTISEGEIAYIEKSEKKKQKSKKEKQ